MPARRVAVIGAGALGLCSALRLAQDGWEVRLHEAAAAPSASAVAAGMLAPASEAVLDGAGPYALLADARDLWASIAPAGAPWLRRDGALHLTPADDVEARLGAFEALGARAWRVPSRAGAPQDAVFTPEDWRLSTIAASAWLGEALAAQGVRRRIGPPLSPQAASPVARGVDAVVLAAGWGAARLERLAPEAALLSPIKGQLLRAPGLGMPAGPVLRAGEVYLVPDPEGLIVGATMEPGVADTVSTEAASASLRRAGAPYAPGLETAEVVAAAGVRATTPDGAPLVGPSSTPGVWWAAGARRNGWLLAPLVAEVLAARLSGRDPGRWASRLDPGRFG